MEYEHGNIITDVMSAGKVVRFKARIDYHERYGLKLIIKEVDTAFTLGALLIERQKLIQELHQKQLIDKNSRLNLTPVLQNLAIISSADAAGYADFKKTSRRQCVWLRFYLELFAAAMQGQRAEIEIVTQLKAINSRASEFDAIIVIRGGGSKFDLSTFDARAIVFSVAESKLPVLTGIGHETDSSVTDLVAHSD